VGSISTDRTNRIKHLRRFRLFCRRSEAGLVSMALYIPFRWIRFKPIPTDSKQRIFASRTTVWSFQGPCCLDRRGKNILPCRKGREVELKRHLEMISAFLRKGSAGFHPESSNVRGLSLAYEIPPLMQPRPSRACYREV
jgi:hypothetical protein